jgi:hypothetical protein
MTARFPGRTECTLVVTSRTGGHRPPLKDALPTALTMVFGHEIVKALATEEGVWIAG